MEERKIIQSGPGSYVVTLPIDWIRKNKFQKGSTVYVKEDTTNTVNIYPKFKEISPERREIIIDASSKTIDGHYNNIISAYLNNSKRITIKNPNNEYRDKIKELVNMLPGLNIVEQTRNIIIIEDVLDTMTVNIINTTKRIDMMIRNMLQGLITSDKTLIIDMDQNIFGQTLFIKRILKYALRDPTIMNTINLNAEKIMEYLVISEQQENISKKIRNISIETIKNNQYKKIFTLLQEQYLDAINSFYTDNRNLANEVFQKHQKIDELLKQTKNSNININNECIIFDKSCRIIARITFDKWNEQTR